MNIYFITFGCKVNLYETENMKQNLSENGHRAVLSEDEADAFVINSCTVTEDSDKKLKKKIRQLKRSYPESIIILTGCFPQAFADKAAELYEADIVTGTKNRAALPDLISRFGDNKQREVSVLPYSRKEAFESMTNTRYDNNTRAFVKIQDGCNMFCSYCIIPYSRGGFRSKPLDSIVSEVSALAAAGYREVVLTGINLSFYGVDLGLRLADAVEAVCEVEGIERVRLGSIEPEVISADDIKRFAEHKKLCPQFHLSLQSGCDKTLNAMNRRYSSADYENVVKLLRTNFENCAITTDIMVGFPDETDDDFAESMKFAEKIGFAKTHIFPYSRRKGTPAAEMEGQIPEEIKHYRAAKMSEAMKMHRKDFLQSQVGTISTVLFEREKSDGFPHGYTPNYTPVKISKKNHNISLRNRIFYVKIIGLDEDRCLGEILYEGE
ncbi:MAG: tRNA (N(6)-L-threonylcarbamoyladenosine(37)-C(2))-methylthiotransferase MtaB [Oscillospiraceae bacterium]|nr:tRNA (N(6)-L-threonylcarbamoyladenosine(37)-C(2))-methylthiotransferase MtaB [Oscillospiraceae bacterium]